MSNDNYTPTPWQVLKKEPKQFLGFETYHIGTEALGALIKVSNSSNVEANAQRIVACVNACEGINPEAVPELLKAMVMLMGCEDVNVDEIGESTKEALELGRLAYTKARE